MTWTVPSNTLVKPFTFVAECDPALDREHPEFKEKYRHYQEQGDQGLLPVRSGQRLAVWELRHLSGRSLTRVLGLMENMYEALYVAAQYAIVGVQNVSIQEGGDFAIEHITCPATRAEMVPDHVMAILQGLSPALIYQIGSCVVKAANPGPL